MGQKQGKKQTGNKMNMMIARTNQFSTRLVGMQLTSGTIIGVCLSMMQLAVGFVFVMDLSTWYQILPIAFVGSLMAILVESLTIGGLGAVRESKALLEKFLDGYYATKREPTPRQVENKERKEKKYKKEIASGWWFARAGMVISIVLGDLFWHHLIALGLGETWLTYIMSAMCASVITLTFVRSELFSGMLFKILRAVLQDNHLMKTAVHAEPENMQLDMLTSAMATVREDEEVRKPIESKIGKVVVKHLSGFPNTFTQISDENTLEGQVTEIQQITAPRQRKTSEKVVLQQEKLREYLAENPGATVREIAEYFGKTHSTVQGWLDKLNVSV